MSIRSWVAPGEEDRILTATSNPMDGSADVKLSKFNRTCSLLRQYIREKGGDTAAGLLGSFPTLKKPAAEGGPSASVPDLNSSFATTATSQMTIFYDGKVLVFDHFPSHKAEQLMDAITKKGGIQPIPEMIVTTAAPGLIHDSNPQPPEGGDPIPAGHAHGPAWTPHDLLIVPGSDLPIARRVSLNRFLEKRKDRIISKAPYRLTGAALFQEARATHSATTSLQPQTLMPEKNDAEVMPSWLGLGLLSEKTTQEV